MCSTERGKTLGNVSIECREELFLLFFSFQLTRFPGNKKSHEIVLPRSGNSSLCRICLGNDNFFFSSFQCLNFLLPLLFGIVNWHCHCSQNKSTSILDSKRLEQSANREVDLIQHSRNKNDIYRYPFILIGTICIFLSITGRGKKKIIE